MRSTHNNIYQASEVHMPEVKYNQQSIRPISLCVFKHKDQILLEKRIHPTTKETIYRPIGGEMKHGEYSWETVRRSVKEMLDEDIKNLIFMGPTEHIQAQGPWTVHEIVFLFMGEFVQRAAYYKEIFSSRPDSEILWMPVTYFNEHKDMLYPQDLVELLISDNTYAFSME